MRLLIQISFTFLLGIRGAVPEWRTAVERLDRLAAERVSISKELKEVEETVSKLTNLVEKICPKLVKVLLTVQGRLILRVRSENDSKAESYLGARDDFLDLLMFMKKSQHLSQKHLLAEFQKLVEQMIRDDLPVGVALEVLGQLLEKTEASCDKHRPALESRLNAIKKLRDKLVNNKKNATEEARRTQGILRAASEKDREARRKNGTHFKATDLTLEIAQYTGRVKAHLDRL